MLHVTRAKRTEWVAVPRLALISCMLLLAGCGASSVTAGVEVVESRSAVVERPGLDPSADDPSSAGADADDSTLDDRFVDVLPGIDVAGGSSPVSRPRTVAMIGDSLTLSAQDEITAALGRTGIHVVSVDGVESRRMVRGSKEVPSGASAIEQILETSDPELWVIALGTNDVGAQTGTEAFRDDMDQLLRLLPSDASVIWVDLWIRDHDDQIVRANEAIRSELSRRRRVGAVVDWHTRADAPGIITGDGVHLTDEGQLLFAESIVIAIDSTFAG